MDIEKYTQNTYKHVPDGYMAPMGVLYQIADLNNDSATGSVMDGWKLGFEQAYRAAKADVYKRQVYGLICDEFYVPMKAKEMAILMNVPKAQRHELQEVLDALVAEGKIEVSSKGKYTKGTSPVSYTHLDVYKRQS